MGFILFLAENSTQNEFPLNKDSFLEKLFPNVWDALAVFLAFIILLIAVFFFAYKPVKNLLKKRGDYVEEKIKSAEDKEREATKLLKDANEEVKAKKIQAIEIVDKAVADATREKDEILNKAKKEKLEEIEKARFEIAQEIEASKDEIHREIVSVAIDASSKILEREVSKEDNEKLVDNFIDDIKKGK